MADDYQCPECGSGDAVSKSVAWDALASVPPKTQKELVRLRRIEAAAQPIKMHQGDENTVVVTIPLSVFNAIRDALQA